MLDVSVARIVYCTVSYSMLWWMVLLLIMYHIIVAGVLQSILYHEYCDRSVLLVIVANEFCIRLKSFD